MGGIFLGHSPLWGEAIFLGYSSPGGGIPRNIAPPQRGECPRNIAPPLGYFQFSMTFNFNIFHCFSNIQDHLAILAIWSAYLVKFLSVDGFICF
jgi:hypothetical protein